MADILFIKTSSLGDVIHHMPALTEAHRALPNARFTWVVEEAFAPLVKMHPAVDAVIPVAWRRWRNALYAPSTLREIAANLRMIRGQHYDAVIDSQGLVRSGAIARVAHGKRHGYDSDSIREPMASIFYNVRHHVSRDLHAIERNRILTGMALGYAPAGAADFGLKREHLQRPGEDYAVLLHATARAEKEWPEQNWIALARALAVPVVLPWGSDTERQRSERIAAALPDARVPPRLPLDEVGAMIAAARFVVGVDTGLSHLAAAFGVPLVTIFAGSRPDLTGPVGDGPIAVLGTDAAPPSVDEVVQATRALAR